VEFDYVIIGGGSAGSVLAGRLTEDPKVTVCLLEAGGDGKNFTTKIPALVAGALRSNQTNWQFETVPQKGLNGRQGYQPRGKALGGSSAINGMIYIRGHRKDYDNWVDMGCEGWGYDDILPYFKKSENYLNGENDYHGGNGPLHVTEPSYRSQVSRDFIAACEANQIHKNKDFNGAKQAGVGFYDVTQFHNDRRGYDGRRGRRCSAATAFLHPIMSRDNLQVVTNAHAQRIVFKEQEAHAVEYTRNKKTHIIRAKHEIILSAGAFQSPQLLMLSGIGDKEHLSEHGINTVYNNPNVGQNLHDHIDLLLGYHVKKNIETFGISPRGISKALKAIGEFKRSGTGFWSTHFSEVGAFYSVGDDAEGWPDIQLHFMPAYGADHGRKIESKPAISCHVCILRPISRGSVKLASNDPSDSPLIDPNFFGEQADMDTLIRGIKKLRQVMATPPMDNIITHDILCSNIKSDEDLIEVIRNNADTVYHPVGTCRMGSDEASVVDTELRVRGVEGLRVIDASIIPQVISGNTNAPAIMIAEKAADMIKQSERA